MPNSSIRIIWHFHYSFSNWFPPGQRLKSIQTFEDHTADKRTHEKTSSFTTVMAGAKIPTVAGRKFPTLSESGKVFNMSKGQGHNRSWPFDTAYVNYRELFS